MVLGVLMDVDPENEDGLWTEPEQEPLDLDDREFWHLLAVMHTVVAVLYAHATHKSAVWRS